MNWRTTNWLLIAAVLLSATILLFERPARLERHRAAGPTPALRDFDPASVIAIDIASASNSVTLRKTNSTWEVAAPARFAAQPQRVDDLLLQLAALESRSLLSAAELKERPQAAAEFGLNPPATTIAVTTRAGRSEILLGSRSISGDKVYFQVAGIPGVFAGNASLADLLPANAQGWRDTTLVPLEHLAFDRIRVASGGSVFTLARDAAGNSWELVEPRPARADAQRIQVLLRQLSLIQAYQFLPAASAPNPELAGLRPPRATLTLARGSNDVFQLAFGAAVSNAPIVYAQRSGEPDLLTVPAAALELLRVPYKNLLDRRVLRFDRSQVREIEIQARTTFSIVRDDQTWRLAPTNVIADAALVGRFLGQLQSLEIADIEKEVVTTVDLPNYGLAPPALRIALRSTPGDTNSTLAVLETGALVENRLFARVSGEQPVYVLHPSEVQELPQASWQLRDRELWKFSAPLVSAVSVQHEGLDWTLRRVGTNDWAVPAGWKNEINPFALDEALHQLSQVRALAIVGEGDVPRLGTTNGPRVTLTFRGNPGPAPVRVAFGKRSPSGNRYGAATAPDGARLTFEFPSPVFDALWKEIGIANTGTATPP